jgi:dTDP-4-dehydrorhamnose 3,5-epimerase
MKFHEQSVEGAFLVDPDLIRDARGHFARMFCEDEFKKHGIAAHILQVNTGFSPIPGTLRGLHYQLPPHEEVKIVRCIRGAVFDVIVDLRPASRTYLRWCSAELTADNGLQFVVPAGCAHGYQTIAPGTELVYATTALYAAGAARGVRYDDPALSIDWPLPVAVISTNDAAWPHLQQEVIASPLP